MALRLKIFLTASAVFLFFSGLWAGGHLVTRQGCQAAFGDDGYRQWASPEIPVEHGRSW